MSTNARNLSTEAFAAAYYIKFGKILVLNDIFRGNIGSFVLNSIVYHIIFRKANIPQHIIIFVKNKCSAFFKTFDYFKLCFFNIFAAAQIFNMACADTGYHRNIRLCRNGKLLYFSKLHHAELKHHCFDGWVKLKHCFRYAYLIIKVILCFKGFIFAFYHRSYHFSCGGFAHASGNCDYNRAEFAAVKTRNVKKRLAGGFYKKQVIRSVIALFLYYGESRALFYGRFYKCVPVKLNTAKRNKKATRFNIPRIRANIGYFNIRKVGFCLCAYGCGNFAKF